MKSVTVASEPQPQPSPSPTPAENVIAVINSIVVNGVKSDTATSSDIELLRAGATAPEATVVVGNQLRIGDRLKTNDQDQVVLRVPNNVTGSDDLVFLDPESEVEIESICARAGRILAWAGIRFRLCTAWGTLGVEGTQFEVNITPNGELTVLVLEGEVKPYRLLTVESPTFIRFAVRDEPKISPGTPRKFKPDGTTEPVEVTAAMREQNIDYWTEQITKASKPAAGVVKDFFVNYPGDSQAEEFKRARRQALLHNSPAGYLAMGKVLNDWNQGIAAQKSFSKVTDPTVLTSAEYMVNVAEAKRLQGDLTAADSQLQRTVIQHPGYAPAYYLKAKVAEQKVADDPVGKANKAPEIRKNLMTALALYSGEPQINTSLIERDLDTTIKTIGNASLTKSPWLSYGNEWFTPRRQTDWVIVIGKASIDVDGRQASGSAELAVLGDQFKLKIADEIFTGRIVGNQNPGGISFAMQFDDAGPINKTKGDAVLSVSGSKVPRGLTLFAAQQSSGSFSFTGRSVIQQQFRND